ncbi:DNA ligase D [Halopseudomonas laoshanensis]|uniref:DNA ligase (ATP) n=1 Tax=Halopseudomonas laoshanensis TaxID=2268758 RepID=A0A7V7GV52_9GAMM|nr:DNA ligase D [Halopseudomonas laoshanensis]KAA0695943.1 DNA ligase D [Halopseudomonas laoshanensis]
MARPESEYNRKRNFALTSEPAEERKSARRNKAGALSFVVQKHDARNLHYDFRLELDGTLKSWAVPKGPSLDPSVKRLAVHVEDHPLSYGNFEGSIPKGQYGGGDVIVWDRGVWEPEGDPVKAYKAGKLGFRLHGEKLEGRWNLVRTRLKGSGSKEQWLLIKEQDDAAQPASEFDLVSARPESVITGERLQRDQQPGAANSKKAAKPKVAASRAPAKAKSATASKKQSSASESRQSRGAAGSKVSIPDQFAPQLATLASEPPAGNWLYEIKFDGYRILARVRDGEVRLFTRNGHDWTHRLPQQAKAIASLNLDDSWLDGEMVVLNGDGLPDFQALQNAFDAESTQDIVYYLFDAPFLNGHDLREQPLEQRRAELDAVIDHDSPLLRFSEVLDADYEHIYQSACAMALEGVIGKRSGSEYVSSRSADWIKLKCRLRQEFVIVGYTPPKGSRSGFGALLLAVHEAPGSKALRYAGRVGTGFNERLLTQLHKQLRKLERKTSPLESTRGLSRQSEVQWVSPKLVCEVEFAQWTQERIVRQAAFIALREDKPAVDIIEEQPQAPDDIQAAAGQPHKRVTRKRKTNFGDKLSGVTISHPERVIDKQSGATKHDLAAFYDSIQDWIIPQLSGRPVSLLRAPEGVDGEQFFQKHAEHLSIPDIRHLDKSLDPGHAPLMQIDSVKALVGAVQMGCIELHTWGALSTSIEKPDSIVLDLDPDPKLPWKSMVEATQLLLSVLDEIGLQAWLKTSGGKGMHVIIPIARHLDWASVKAFSKAISEFMAQELPERFVSKMGPKNRIGKIFIDYLRNSRGASTVAAYSVRARPGLPVSVPIARDELAGLRSAQQWTLLNLSERLQQLQKDPWADLHYRQRIGKAMWKQLGAKAP